MFKALTWIWLSNGNGQALPIEVDKAPSEKKWIWENISHNKGPPPPHLQDTQYFFKKKLTIEAQDTNRYPTLRVIITL